MEDKKIIELFNERSELAVATVEKQYGNYLNKIAKNILGDDSDAEECVNDTYLRAWDSIPPNCPSNLKIYLGKITRNLSLDLFNKNTAIKRGGSNMDVVLDEIGEIIPDVKSEKEQESAEIIKAINKFLEEQTCENRKIFIRRYWYLDSILDIAKLYHLSESKVKTTLFRMRKGLREELLREGIEI